MNRVACITVNSTDVLYLGFSIRNARPSLRSGARRYRVLAKFTCGESD